MQFNQDLIMHHYAHLGCNGCITTLFGSFLLGWAAFSLFSSFLSVGLELGSAAFDLFSFGLESAGVSVAGSFRLKDLNIGPRTTRQ